MSLAESEYTVLRHTIASRGTARITLLPVTLIGWALIAGGLAGGGAFTDGGGIYRFSMKDRPMFRGGRQRRWPSGRPCLAAESTHSSA